MVEENDTPTPRRDRGARPQAEGGLDPPEHIDIVDENAYTPGDVAIPPTLGGYEVLEPLSSEPAWTTHLGRHIALDRAVAIKFLSPLYRARGSHARRFQREARALAALSHPNVVTLYDYGDHRGLLYMILELVTGGTLLELVQEQGALPVERALRLARQVLRGLLCAHELGIVHRDLRPEILLLTTTDQIKIGQFRLASLSYLDASTTGIESSALRSFAFLAPEQCMASGAGVDHRCDLYAVGSLLFQLLTGREAFASDNPVQILETKLRPPPDPRELVPAIPAHVAAVVRRLLAANADDRPASAREVLAALDAPPDGDEAEVTRARAPLSSRGAAGGIELVLATRTREYRLTLQPGCPVSIGRSSVRSDCAVPDPRMSRQHCEVILRETGGVWARDLQTVNGTFLNRERVHGEAVELFAGDRLQLGDTVLEVRPGGGKSDRLLRARRA